MKLIFLIRICNLHVILELIFGYIYIYSIELDNPGLESTLFWIITTLSILLYCSSIFIGFMLSNTNHKFHNILEVVFPPLFALVSYLFGDFDFYVQKLKINEISKTYVIYITWMVNSVCEFFIDIPKVYIFSICERFLKEKGEIYNSNKFVIETTKTLAYIGAFKGIIAILFSIYSFATYMLNDNINLGRTKGEQSDQDKEKLKEKLKTKKNE